MNQEIPTVIVTGSSRGIGRAIARSAAEAGWSVGINCLNDVRAAEDTLKLCKQSKRGKRQKFVILQADVSATGGRTKLFDGALTQLGRIDALVNNAGIGPRVRNDITQMTVESYAEVMRVNLEGPLFLTQTIVNYWLTEKLQPILPGGFKVIFISSLSAYAASVDRGEYCISKAALSMVSKLWALRLARDRVQVFEVRPGIIDTDMTSKVKEKYDGLIANGIVPQMRWGKPEDVGEVVRAILIGNYSYSTGEVINVDGGFHLQRL